MDLGIDLGTTYTAVAAVDDGNHRLLPFFDTEGDSHDQLPSVRAAVNGSLIHGFDARAAMADGAPGVRSVKPLLASPGADPSTLVHTLSRGFGVFRETESGRGIGFDVLTDQNTRLSGTTTITRRHRCHHNIGAFRIPETGIVTATISDVDTGWPTTATMGRPTTSTGMGHA